jgi:phosphotransferase system  glucose/maltose/N-acetylglucosamine-specific IIC component
MSIPKLVPFVTSCISATCAGFFIGGMQAWLGINMGVNMLYGVDGVWGLFTTTSTFHGQPLYGKMVYAIGISIACVSSFLFTRIAYQMFKNHPKIKWDLN